MLLGGFLASQGHLDIATLIVLVVTCAIVGDTVGYEVGKHMGPRVLRMRVFEKTSRGSAKPRTCCVVEARRSF